MKSLSQPLITHADSAVILVYHSINSPGENRIRLPNIVSPERFERQLRFLAANTCVISLEEYLKHAADRRRLPERCMILTFDDGYRDNFTVAYPMLRHYGLPATFFLATDYIGSGKAKWEDRLNCLIRRTPKRELTLDMGEKRVRLSFLTQSAKFRVIGWLVDQLGWMTSKERDSVLEQIEEQADASCGDGGDIMMNWEDARQIADTAGMSIGAHTASHCHLTRVSETQMKMELDCSIQRIEDEIGRKVWCFAYPYGDFNAETERVVRRGGLQCACTLDYGANTLDSSLYLLKRVIAANEQGVRFRVGLRLRSSVLGETMKQLLNRAIRLRHAGIQVSES